MKAERRKQEIKEQKEMYDIMRGNTDQMASTLRVALELMDSLEEKLSKNEGSLITISDEVVKEFEELIEKTHGKADMLEMMKCCYIVGKTDAYSIVRRSLKNYIEED